MFETHDFYCIKCGKKGIPLSRKRSKQHKSFHRKKLYCVYCQEEVNHIECKTSKEVEKFLKNFNKGVYKDEAEESVLTLRSVAFL